MNTIDEKLNYLIENGSSANPSYVFFACVGEGSTSAVNCITAAGEFKFYDENYFIFNNDSIICRKKIKFRGCACIEGTYSATFYIQINNETKATISVPDYHKQQVSEIIEANENDVITLKKINSGNVGAGKAILSLEVW